MSVTFYTTNHFWHHYPFLYVVADRGAGPVVVAARIVAVGGVHAVERENADDEGDGRDDHPQLPSEERFEPGQQAACYGDQQQDHPHPGIAGVLPQGEDHTPPGERECDVAQQFREQVPAPVEEVDHRHLVTLTGGDPVGMFPIRILAFGDQKTDSLAVDVTVDPEVALVRAVVAHFVVALPERGGLADEGEFCQ